MKKYKILFVVMLMTSVSLLSFTYHLKDNEKTQSLFSANQNDWGQWKTTSCYRYLKYQIKKGDYDGKWYIRFENNYNQSISLTVEVTGNRGVKTDSGRWTISSGDTQSIYYLVDPSATAINFSVEKVKFNDSSWGGPYVGCDH